MWDLASSAASISAFVFFGVGLAWAWCLASRSASFLALASLATLAEFLHHRQGFGRWWFLDLVVD